VTTGRNRGAIGPTEFLHPTGNEDCLMLARPVLKSVPSNAPHYALNYEDDEAAENRRRLKRVERFGLGGATPSFAS
jgi:hypothetical protein